MPRQKRIPGYLLHKPTGQAYVRVNGRCRYLGAYNSPESRQLYERIIAEFLDEPDVTFNGQQITINDLCIQYVQQAKRFYVKDGRQTSEVHCIRAALKPLVKLFGETKAVAFGPRRLKDVREEMIRKGHARKPINKNVGRIRSMFKWAVAEELLPVSVHSSLLCVQGLRSGRTEARESQPVAPVSMPHIEAIKKEVSRSVAGLIEFQLRTGARPGEAVIARLCDIVATGSIWEFIPRSHKTQHHGRDRKVMIGPRGQELIRQYMTTDTTAPLFPNRFGKVYSVHGYRTAIRRACQRLDVPVWKPNQLRHSFATTIRREAGIETTRVVLGHSSAVTSEIYAEKDFDAARTIMAKIG